MGESSKDLLNLEKKKSKLIVCKNDFVQTQNSNPKPPDGMPFTSSVPKSQDLHLLNITSLEPLYVILDIPVNTMASTDNANDYDIEALTGNESEYIEMDLMLGIADLHTPKALAAAESAIQGYQPVISLSTISSSDDSSDDESTDDDTDDDDGGDGDHLPCSPTKTKRSNPPEDDGSTNPSRNGIPKKQPKNVELS
ncbi:hypothetical protein RHGRI_005253 [Rhododendron griersonianum]|uniref:Uncharacterized protein n=1 Tax=Rhododendron griersonianum TaxID=479676 RepID=A0AAV6LCM1_9ERIC|nr:hypothetical protein RHGRI_005253 [Rhododendron griersonianum]